MQIADLIKYLRNSVDIRLPDSGESDKKYLLLSDEDIILYLNIAKTRAFADETLDDFPEEYVYPLMLIAKKELYIALALRHASDVDLTADDNNQIKRSQWYTHYKNLADEMEDCYANYLDQGGEGSNTLCSANTYLSSRYYTPYNREKEIPPSIKVRASEVTSNYIEITWKYSCSRLRYFKVYVSTSPILDCFESGVETNIDELVTLKDPVNNHCRITGCEPNTQYYILMSITDWAGVTTYHQIDTLTSSDEETDIPIEELPDTEEPSEDESVEDTV